MMKRTRGRPRGEAQTSSISFRIERTRKAVLKRAAQLDGKTLTEFALQHLDRVADAIMHKNGLKRPK